MHERTKVVLDWRCKTERKLSWTGAASHVGPTTRTYKHVPLRCPTDTRLWAFRVTVLWRLTRQTKVSSNVCMWFCVRLQVLTGVGRHGFCYIYIYVYASERRCASSCEGLVEHPTAKPPGFGFSVSALYHIRSLREVDTSPATQSPHSLLGRKSRSRIDPRLLFSESGDAKYLRTVARNEEGRHLQYNTVSCCILL